MRARIVAAALAVVFIIAVVAQASAVYLGANMKSAVTIYQGETEIYRFYNTTEAKLYDLRSVDFAVGVDDLQRLLDSYPDAEVFYVVVNVSKIDRYDAKAPQIHVILLRNGAVVYGSPYVTVPENGTVVFTVWRDLVKEMSTSQTPTIRIVLPAWALPYNGDDRYGVTVSSVAIAPPEYVPHQGVRVLEPAQGAGTQFGFAALAVAFVFALVAAVIVAALRG